MALNNEVNINKVLSQYSERVEQLRSSLNEINHGYDDVDIELLSLRMFKEEVADFISSWISYSSTYNYAVEKDVKALQNQNSELVKKNSELVGESKGQAREIRELVKKNSELEEKITEQLLIIGQLKGFIEAKEEASNMVSIDLIDTIDKLDKAVRLVDNIQNNTLVDFKSLDKVEELVEMVKGNVGFLRNQREIKEQSKRPDRVGEKAPAWRQDVDNKLLIDDYKNGLSISELATKYNMTYQGVRYRIKKA